MRKSKETLEYAGLKIPKSQKERLMRVAKERETTLTELLTDGAEMLAGFSNEFLAMIDGVAFSTKLSAPQVLTQLILTYAAADAAVLEVYGHSTTFKRAFSFQDGELLTGSKLSDKVYAEVLKASKDLKERLQDSAKGKTKGTYISNEDAAQMAIQMPAVQMAAQG